MPHLGASCSRSCLLVEVQWLLVFSGSGLKGERCLSFVARIASLLGAVTGSWRVVCANVVDQHVHNAWGVLEVGSSTSVAII